MANYRESLIAQLESLYLELSIVEANTALIDQGLVPTDEYALSGSRAFKLAIIQIIPSLLARPDVTEGGYSVKFDRVAVEKYYAWLTNELGVPNTLTPGPTLKNKSFLW